MKQQTLAVAGGFERFGRQSRRAEFLSQMELVVPWAELVALIEPHYPSHSDKGRPRDRLWNGCCGFIFFSSGSTCPTLRSRTRSTSRLSMRGFAGIDLPHVLASADATTVLKLPPLAGGVTILTRRALVR